MFKPVHLLACATIFAFASGCAGPPGAPLPHFAQAQGPQCFRDNQVYGFRPAADGAVDVMTRQGPFRLHLGPGCPDFSWIMQIGVRTVDSSWLCEGKPDQLITAYQTPYSRCPILNVQALGPGGAWGAQAASGAATTARERFSAPAIPAIASSAPTIAMKSH